MLDDGGSRVRKTYPAAHRSVPGILTNAVQKSKRLARDRSGQDRNVRCVAPLRGLAALPLVLLCCLSGCHNPNMAEGAQASVVTSSASVPSAAAPSTVASTPPVMGSAPNAADAPDKQAGQSLTAASSANAGGSASLAADTSAPVHSAGRAPRPSFDADAAFKLLTRQCEFGPRALGSKAHDKTRDYLLQEMKQYADVTVAQTFDYRGLPVTNVIGVFYPAGATTPSRSPVLLLTHWDSRPIADGPYSTEASKAPPFQYGASGWNRTTPIMAASDGASGTAVLLQMARMFKQNPPPVGVVILLDDGEDYGDFQANSAKGEGIELGSRYFATHFRNDKRFGRPSYGILLDMVGGKDLVLPMEANSMKYAPGTMTKVYQAGQALGYRNTFRSDLSFNVNDDHIALNEAGLHVIDLVPYFGDTAPPGVTGYIYWHTLQDTADKCSAESLKIVGETLAEVLYNEAPGS